MRISRRSLLAAGLLVPLAPAGAQTYPNRPIRLISPFAPGGGTDILGRLLAPRMGEVMGGTMIVENRAGAGGNVGAQAVARSDPDGYSLLMAVNSYTINANILKAMPFDIAKDFTPIGVVATSPFILVVHPSLPAKTVPELVAYAKQNPGKLNFGSAGQSTAPHLAMELFKLAAGLEMTHVPYQGSGPNVTGQLRGDVQVSAISLNSIEGFLGSDQVRPIATMSQQRIARLPDIPTIGDRTGDLGRLDENGCFVFVGRSTEMIKRAGINISPAEVEDVLVQHPDVEQAAVVGVPDRERGELVIAFIVARDGANPTAEDIIRHCRSVASKYKVPDRIELSAALPVTPTGKLQRRELRRFALEHLSGADNG